MEKSHAHCIFCTVDSKHVGVAVAPHPDGTAAVHKERVEAVAGGHDYEEAAHAPTVTASSPCTLRKGLFSWAKLVPQLKKISSCSRETQTIRGWPLEVGLHGPSVRLFGAEGPKICRSRQLVSTISAPTRERTCYFCESRARAHACDLSEGWWDSLV